MPTLQQPKVYPSRNLESFPISKRAMITHHFLPPQALQMLRPEEAAAAAAEPQQPAFSAPVLSEEPEMLKVQPTSTEEPLNQSAAAAFLPAVPKELHSQEVELMLKTLQAPELFSDGDLTVLSEYIVPTISPADPLARFIRIKREPFDEELLIEPPTKVTARQDPVAAGQPLKGESPDAQHSREGVKRQLISCSLNGPPRKQVRFNENLVRLHYYDRTSSPRSGREKPRNAHAPIGVEPLVQPARMAAPVLVSPEPLPAALSPASVAADPRPFNDCPVIYPFDEVAFPDPFTTDEYQQAMPNGPHDLVNPAEMPMNWSLQPLQPLQPAFQQHLMPVLYNEFTRSYFLPNGTPLVVADQADDVAVEDEIDVVTLDEDTEITTQEQLAAALAQWLQTDARLRQFMDAHGGDPIEMGARAAAAMMRSMDFTAETSIQTVPVTTEDQSVQTDSIEDVQEPRIIVHDVAQALGTDMEAEEHVEKPSEQLVSSSVGRADADADSGQARLADADTSGRPRRLEADVNLDASFDSDENASASDGNSGAAPIEVVPVFDDMEEETEHRVQTRSARRKEKKETRKSHVPARRKQSTNTGEYRASSTALRVRRMR